MSQHVYRFSIELEMTTKACFFSSIQCNKIDAHRFCMQMQWYHIKEYTNYHLIFVDIVVVCCVNGKKRTNGWAMISGNCGDYSMLADRQWRLVVVVYCAYMEGSDLISCLKMMPTQVENNTQRSGTRTHFYISIQLNI